MEAAQSGATKTTGEITVFFLYGGTTHTITSETNTLKAIRSKIADRVKAGHRRCVISLRPNGPPIVSDNVLKLNDKPLYVRLLPPYAQWTHKTDDDEGNSIARLTLCALNIYRSWAEIEEWDPHSKRKILDRFNLSIVRYGEAFAVSALSRQIIGVNDVGDWMLQEVQNPMTYVWTVFPQANDRRWTSDWIYKRTTSIQSYVRRYKICAKRTFDAMLRADSTDMIWNMCGGGAFLRGCPVEDELFPIIVHRHSQRSYGEVAIVLEPF